MLWLRLACCEDRSVLNHHIRQVKSRLQEPRTLDSMPTLKGQVCRAQGFASRLQMPSLCMESPKLIQRRFDMFLRGLQRFHELIDCIAGL